VGILVQSDVPFYWRFGLSEDKIIQHLEELSRSELYRQIIDITQLHQQRLDDIEYLKDSNDILHDALEECEENLMLQHVNNPCKLPAAMTDDGVPQEYVDGSTISDEQSDFEIYYLLREIAKVSDEDLSSHILQLSSELYGGN
jgi:hypothetical protein